jgi:hypothetical protein
MNLRERYQRAADRYIADLESPKPPKRVPDAGSPQW